MDVVLIGSIHDFATVSDVYPDLKLFILLQDDENNVPVYRAELCNPGGRT
jgi:hypothetical protein